MKPLRKERSTMFMKLSFSMLTVLSVAAGATAGPWVNLFNGFMGSC